mgnify:CR=1 FL=1
MYSMRFWCIALTLFSCVTVISSCSGYGSNYQEEDPYAEWDYKSSSSYSSSSNRYLSSSYSSSSERYSSFDYLYSSSVTDSTISKSDFDISEECINSRRITIAEDSVTYHCAFNRWFKEVFYLPDTCTKAEEKHELYKNAAYVCKSGVWETITEEEGTLGYCTSKLQGNTRSIDSIYYTCDSLKWRIATDLEALGDCKDSVATRIEKVNGTSYICRNKKWETASTAELRKGLCTSENAGDTVYISSRMECTMGTCIASDAIYYVCKNNRWTITKNFNEILGMCKTDRDAEMERVYAGAIPQFSTSPKESYLVCQDGAWREATSNEILIKKACTSGNQDSVLLWSRQAHFICDKGDWRAATPEEYYGNCNNALQDTIYYDSTNYVCDMDMWIRLSTPPDNSMGLCRPSREGDIERVKSGTKYQYWLCHSNSWVESDSLSYKFGHCNADSVGHRNSTSSTSLSSTYECRDLGSGIYRWVKLTLAEVLETECTAQNDGSIKQGYVCDNSSWRMQINREKSLGKACTKNMIGTETSQDGETYECQANGWISYTEMMTSLGTCAASGEGRILRDGTTTKICYLHNWVTLGQLDVNLNKDCLKDYGIGLIGDMIYYCPGKLDKWQPIGIGMELGIACTKENVGFVAMSKDSIYYKCIALWENITKWTPRSIKNILNESPCSDQVIVGQKYTCSAGTWTPAYGTMKDPRDGKSYKTLKVGKQIWMAENLNYQTSSSWCYDNNDLNCEDLGRFYTWNNISSACPEGWHVPSVNDFWDYEDHPLAPNILSEDSWQEKSPETRGSIQGLEIKAAGFRNSSGSFEYRQRVATIWLADAASSTEGYIKAYGSTQNQSWTTSLPSKTFTSTDSTRSKFTASSLSKSYALPIRCLKDN